MQTQLPLLFAVSFSRSTLAILNAQIFTSAFKLIGKNDFASAMECSVERQRFIGNFRAFPTVRIIWSAVCGLYTFIHMHSIWDYSFASGYHQVLYVFLHPNLYASGNQWQDEHFCRCITKRRNLMFSSTSTYCSASVQIKISERRNHEIRTVPCVPARYHLIITIIHYC